MAESIRFLASRLFSSILDLLLIKITTPPIINFQFRKWGRCEIIRVLFPFRLFVFFFLIIAITYNPKEALAFCFRGTQFSLCMKSNESVLASWVATTKYQYWYHSCQLHTHVASLSLSGYIRSRVYLLAILGSETGRLTCCLIPHSSLYLDDLLFFFFFFRAYTMHGY